MIYWNRPLLAPASTRSRSQCVPMSRPNFPAAPSRKFLRINAFCFSLRSLTVWLRPITASLNMNTNASSNGQRFFVASSRRELAGIRPNDPVTLADRICQGTLSL
jgi:hypothetical protein